jgi:hypothetical protein
MTENNKPEWFEIAENDQRFIPRKASKTLPLAAVFAVALILGIGAIVAQTQEESPAAANETASVQSPTTGDTASTATITPAASPSTSTAVSTTPNLQNPSIAQLPTKSGDDEDEGGEEGRHGKHRENGEGDDEGEGDDD